MLTTLTLAIVAASPKLGAPDPAAFERYWYAGAAEITSYDLSQARYGEAHPGHAVLIFVTEPFSKKKQVKLDDAATAGGDAVPVLKLNLTKKFDTGIYPYSVMQSVFTPVDRARHGGTLKTTMSSQEWCGHVFTQLNLRGSNYDITAYSYFESEGDGKQSLPRAMLEDEIWNLIRIDPSKLPTGRIELIPSTINARLRHIPLKVEKAQAKLHSAGPNARYTLEYGDLGRTLSIDFKPTFPYEIVRWSETGKSGWGEGAKTLTTHATVKKSILVDYWNRNGVSDASWRGKLGLD